METPKTSEFENKQTPEDESSLILSIHKEILDSRGKEEYEVIAKKLRENLPSAEALYEKYEECNRNVDTLIEKYGK